MPYQSELAKPVLPISVISFSTPCEMCDVTEVRYSGPFSSVLSDITIPQRLQTISPESGIVTDRTLGRVGYTHPAHFNIRCRDTFKPRIFLVH
jgi:hypothetical protein